MRTLTILALLLASCASVPHEGRRPKVLLIGIDGCRPDGLVAADTPNVDRLARDGTLSLDAQTCARTSSGPSWTSLLTGTWPAKHGVVDNSFESHRLERYPHVFVHVERERPALVTASVVQWAPIHESLVAGADLSLAPASGDEVAATAATLLREQDPDFLFLHFDDVDHAGHEHGYGPEVPAYLAAIEAVDEDLGTVLAALRARPAFGEEDWLVLVTTDHGGTGTSHGRDEPLHRTIFLLVSGPSARRAPVEPAPGIVDGAATALVHLGIPPRPEWELDGRPVGL